MKASELRIGNWVEYYYPHDEEWDRLDITLEDLKDIEGDSGELFRPLPLTEDWLKRLGFKVWTSGTEWEHKDKLFEVAKRDDGSFIQGINVFEYHHGEPFYFVHQLQNLFYATTHKELTFSPHSKGGESVKHE